jgi:hypothetical protein
LLFWNEVRSIFPVFVFVERQDVAFPAAALRGTHHAHLLQLIQQTRGARIPDPEASLQE